MEKKVSITQAFYNKLITDMETFSYKKENGEYKQNDFFTTVIINTYKYRSINEQSIATTIKNILLDKDNKLANNEIINSIKENKDNPYFNNNVTDLVTLLSNKEFNVEIPSQHNCKNIFIRSTLKNDALLQEVINSSIDLPSASIFRNLLYEYMSYPMYVREKILFLDNYLKLMFLKENNLTCLLESKKTYLNRKTNKKYHNYFEFKLFDVVGGKEEYHYYVVGIGKNTNNKYDESIMSFKLSSINKVIANKITYALNNYQQNEIKDKLTKGPEWISGIHEEIKVEFSEYGITLFEALYKDRPIPSKKEENIYYFNCSENSIINYLKPFGRHANVIYPLKCKEKLLDFYKKAYDKYNQ